MIGSSDYAFFWIALKMMEESARNPKKAEESAGEPRVVRREGREPKGAKSPSFGIRKAFEH